MQVSFFVFLLVTIGGSDRDLVSRFQRRPVIMVQRPASPGNDDDDDSFSSTYSGYHRFIHPLSLILFWIIIIIHMPNALEGGRRRCWCRTDQCR